MRRPSLVLIPVACFLACQSAAEEAPSRTYVPGEISEAEFTVPAPPEPPPPMRIDGATFQRKPGGHTFTILRGEPSELPDLPEKPPVVVPARSGEPPAPPEHPAERQEIILMGATVYGPGLSHAIWTDPRTGERCEAVCGFDFGLLSGFTSFVHEGREHSLILMHSRAEGSRAAAPASWPQPSRDGFAMLAGDAAGAAPFQKLVDLLRAERPRLEAAAAEREKNRRAAKEWREANPEPSRNHTLWLRPHRGSRYLAETTEKGGER